MLCGIMLYLHRLIDMNQIMQIFKSKCTNTTIFFHGLSVLDEAPFSWKSLKIGSISVRGIIKTSPTYKLITLVGPVPPTALTNQGGFCRNL